MVNRPLPTRLALLVCLLVACGGQAARTCEEMSPGIDRDRCLHDEIGRLPGTAAPTVLAKGRLIDDTIIRGSAVSAWVAAHVKELNPQMGQELCSLLEGQDKAYCLRRLSSPHLQR